MEPDPSTKSTSSTEKGNLPTTSTSKYRVEIFLTREEYLRLITATTAADVRSRGRRHRGSPGAGTRAAILAWTDQILGPVAPGTDEEE